MTTGHADAFRLPPTNARPAIIFGLAVILFGVGTFCAWASFANLSSAIIGNGVVKVLSNRKKVQVPVAGTIISIDVVDGKKVVEGDVLVRLDDTSERATMNVLQGNYDFTVATVARLTAERNGQDEIAFPAELLEKMATPEVADFVDGQPQLFEMRKQS